MDDVVGVSGAALSGGLFGLIGTALGRAIGVVERRQDMAHERERWAHELRLHDLALKAEAAETERELAVLAAEGSYSGLEASLNAASQSRPSYRWVEAVRALVRPVLTPVLWLLYLVVFFGVANGAFAERLAPGTADDLLGYFVTNVAFAATAATLWWFGDRAPKPRPPTS